LDSSIEVHSLKGNALMADTLRERVAEIRSQT
jgi:hypothetical protein